MPIQHYVSQFLTKPWQRPKTKTLVYYDFETDRIAEAKAKDLFAGRDVHTKRVEQRLHELIEDPLARLWHRVRKEGVEPLTDPREIRAAHLVFLAQPVRIADYRQEAPSAEGQLEELLGKEDAYLDALVALEMREYDLRVFAVTEGPPIDGSSESSRSALFYPQTGMLAFPLLEDPQKKPLGSVTGGFGIPLHPHVVLTLIPKTAQEPYLATAREMFQAFSVGLSEKCTKVVVPATIAERYDHMELAARIKVQRALAREVVATMSRLQKLIVEAHRIAGLTS